MLVLWRRRVARHRTFPSVTRVLSLASASPINIPTAVALHVHVFPLSLFISRLNRHSNSLILFILCAAALSLYPSGFKPPRHNSLPPRTEYSPSIHSYSTSASTNSPLFIYSSLLSLLFISYSWLLGGRLRAISSVAASKLCRPCTSRNASPTERFSYSGSTAGALTVKGSPLSAISASRGGAGTLLARLRSAGSDWRGCGVRALLSLCSDSGAASLADRSPLSVSPLSSRWTDVSLSLPASWRLRDRLVDASRWSRLCSSL